MDSSFRHRILFATIGTIIVAVVFAGIAAFNKIAGKRIILFAPDFKEYPLLDLYENIYKPFYGRVIKVETHSDIGYITLSNGTKFSIDKFTNNYECQPSRLR